MAERLGPAAPQASGPEAETLRRFRTFASTALMRGVVPSPALDGLRPNERRVMALLDVWSQAAGNLAGSRSRELMDALAPLLAEFRLSLRRTSSNRQAKGKPRAKRRAVVAAIDRITDAFLAIDVEDGKIVDANPAAGALLGVDRDALLGVDALSFVASSEHDRWWGQLDAVAEGNDGDRFTARLVDTAGTELPLDATVTRFSTRGRTLALMMLRPPSSNRVTPSRDLRPERTE